MWGFAGKSDYYLSVITAQAGIQKNSGSLLLEEHGFEGVGKVFSFQFNE